MEEYCAFIITPDSIRLRIEEDLLTDLLQRTQASVICKKYIRIREESVKFLYPTKVMKTYFSSMVDNMIEGKSLLLVVKSHPGIAERIKKVKGRFYVRKDGRLEVDGLRQKYGACIVWHGSEKDAGKMGVYEFRLHASDNLEEAALICALFLSKRELRVLNVLAQPLYVKATELIQANPLIRKANKI